MAFSVASSVAYNTFPNPINSDAKESWLSKKC